MLDTGICTTRSPEIKIPSAKDPFVRFTGGRPNGHAVVDWLSTQGFVAVYFYSREGQTFYDGIKTSGPAREERLGIVLNGGRGNHTLNQGSYLVVHKSKTQSFTLLDESAFNAGYIRIDDN